MRDFIFYSGAASKVIPGNRSFVPFCPLDSVKLESAFLQRRDEIERSWLEAIAAQEAREAAARGKWSWGTPGAAAPPAGASDACVSGGAGDGGGSSSDVPACTIGVRGDLFEVCLERRTCLPVYWAARDVLEASCVVRRGLWFADGWTRDRKAARLPLREDVCWALEDAVQSRGVGNAETRVELPFARQLALFKGGDVARPEVFLVCEEAASGGATPKQTRLFRGYEETSLVQVDKSDASRMVEEDYAAATPVGHLLLAVHGIGQTAKNADIVKEVALLRQSLASVSSAHLTEHQRGALRVEVLPVQWRKTMTLDADVLLEDITPDELKVVRQLVNATVMDVLYYMSPRHCQDIINSVAASLNKVYHTFKQRNPSFNGKVSIFGHSLGSVLVYDILCHQLQHDSTGEPAATTITAASTAGSDTSSATGEGAAASSAQPGPSLDAFEDRDEDGGAVGPYDGLTWGGFTGRPERRQSWRTSHATEEPVTDAATQMERLQQQIESAQAHVELLKRKRMAIAAGMPGASQGWQPGQQAQPQPPAGTRVGLAGEDGQAPADVSAKRRKGAHRKVEMHVHYPHLEFQVDTFFAVGSPLGMFLSLRGWSPEHVLGGSSAAPPLSPGASEEYLPSVRRVINLFHPHDPVAYRLEPLIASELAKSKPEKVVSAANPQRVAIGPQLEAFPAPPPAPEPPSTFSFESAMRTFFSVLADPRAATGSGQRPAATPPPQLAPHQTRILERWAGHSKGRVDFSLNESLLVPWTSYTGLHYLSALYTHTIYWGDADTALFVIRQFYQDIPAYITQEAQQAGEVMARDSVH
eukprot:jgi/Mesvir1/2152/Mv16669-RA.2